MVLMSDFHVSYNMGFTFFINLGQNSSQPSYWGISFKDKLPLKIWGIPALGLWSKLVLVHQKHFDVQIPRQIGKVKSGFTKFSNEVTSFLLPFIFLTLVRPTNWCKHLAIDAKFGMNQW